MDSAPSPRIPRNLSPPPKGPRGNRRLSMVVPPLSFPSSSSFDAPPNGTPPQQRRRSESVNRVGEDFVLPALASPRVSNVEEIKQKPHRGTGPLHRWKKEFAKKRKKMGGEGVSHEELGTSPSSVETSPAVQHTKIPPPSIVFENKTTGKKRVLIRQPSMSDPHLRAKVPPELLQQPRKNSQPRPRSPSYTSDPFSSYSTPYPSGDINKITRDTHFTNSTSRALPALQKMVEKLEGDNRNLLVSTLVAIHGNPVYLFEESLRIETKKEPRMETLMRLTCPSVCILTAIAKPFLAPLSDLASPLIELAHTISQRDIDSLLPFPSASPPPSPAFSPTLSPCSSRFQLSPPTVLSSSSFNSSSESSSYFSCSSPIPTLSPTLSPSLSSNIHRCISLLLSPTSFHLFYLFHTLCYRASEVVKNTIGGEEDKIHQWATTSVLFLRFLVPLIIQSSSSSATFSPSSSSSATFSPSSSSSPGPRFIGKLLMKMCTQSTFAPNSSPRCPADALLSSLSPLFSKFCEEMVEIGKKTWMDEIGDTSNQMSFLGGGADGGAEQKGEQRSLANMVCERLLTCPSSLETFIRKEEVKTEEGSEIIR